MPATVRSVTDVALDVPGAAGTAARTRTRLALAIWAAVVAAGAIVALALNATGQRISINAPPLHAGLDPRVTANAVLVVLIGGLAVVYGPRVAMSLRWPRLLLGSAFASVLWSVSLASVPGVDRIVSPVRSPREYLAAVPQVHDLGAFLGGFVENIRAYPVHVQGHPPGTVVLLAALRNIGFGGANWTAVLFVVGGALAVPAALLATRDVAGEQMARRAAPFLVIAPTAIWLATSADSLYTGVSAWGAALVVVATGRRDRLGDVSAAAGGVLLGVSAFCSYGLVLVAVVPIAVAVARRRIRPLLMAAAAQRARHRRVRGCGLLVVRRARGDTCTLRRGHRLDAPVPRVRRHRPGGARARPRRRDRGRHRQTARPARSGSSWAPLWPPSCSPT